MTKGYYRVFYDDYDLIFENLQKMCVEDRYGIVDDCIFHFYQGLFSFEKICKLVSSLIPEYEYIIINCLVSFFKKILADQRLSSYILPILRSLLVPIWEKYGLESNSASETENLTQIAYINLIEACKDSEIINSIISCHSNSQKYKKLYYSCIITTKKCDLYDLACTDTDFACELLIKTSDISLLRFVLNFYRFSTVKDSFGYEVIEKLNNAKFFENAEFLLQAVILEFFEKHENDFRFFLKYLAFKIAENSSFEVNKIISFLRNSLSQYQDRGSDEALGFLRSCISIVSKKNSIQTAYDNILAYFVNLNR